MTKMALFLGCIVPNRYPGIEKATDLCLERLGIDCIELEDASCCPAPGVFRSFDKATWLTIAARNISLAEKLDRDILTICNGCYGSLNEANAQLKEQPQLRKKVNEHLRKIGFEFRGQIRIRHIIEFLSEEPGPEQIREMVTNPLSLRVAVHYGCHMIKPSEHRIIDSVERPHFFDELVEATGAESVDYADKNECCGAGGGVRSGLHEKSLEMAGYKLSIIDEAGIDCIVDACPFCHMQFDSGQAELNDLKGTEYRIPVLHYTQLLGLAFGYTPQDLGIDLNITVDENLTHLWS